MYLTVLNLLCLSISLISGQITYPDMRWSRCGRITEVGLYIYMKKPLFAKIIINHYFQICCLHLKFEGIWWPQGTKHCLYFVSSINVYSKYLKSAYCELNRICEIVILLQYCLKIRFLHNVAHSIIDYFRAMPFKMM